MHLRDEAPIYLNLTKRIERNTHNNHISHKYISLNLTKRIESPSFTNNYASHISRNLTKRIERSVLRLFQPPKNVNRNLTKRIERSFHASTILSNPTLRISQRELKAAEWTMMLWTGKTPVNLTKRIERRIRR